MRKAGVIGWPVSHSLSPKLHRYWLKIYGIDGDYVPIAVAPNMLEDTLKSLTHKGFAGVNVTLPHKEKILPLMDALDDAAQAIGAVNTVVMEGRKLKGMNTDAYGFMENLKQTAMPDKKSKAVILGAGGAAKAIHFALAQEGFTQIISCNRKAGTWESRHAALEGAGLIVNATSLGLEGGEPLMLSLEKLPKDAVVCDIVYRPLDTPLLKAARARGNKTVDGLGMLIHQAVPAFEAWFGVRPKADDKVREHLLHGG